IRLSYLCDEFWKTDSTQTLKDGNGRTFIYYESGFLNEFYTYKDGIKDGDFEEYTPNKNLLLLVNILKEKNTENGCISIIWED
ncbi:MAG: hypothetical protein IPM74_19485, partial [Crocinitomicaceae bacterium]|nr:hypothetical protein [Crocinitomicaceae bacterium]